MSLQNLAKELEKKGRGKDRMLVHMTPREVSGLQAIAKAHGGSLSINPDTGLVEAGFLDNLLPSLLPMAAGAALTIGSGGALSPLAAAMITGGGYGLATGSVEKGLMAGLGAFGGAGLAGSLAGTGAAATLTEAQTAAQAAEAANAGVIPQAPTTIPGTTGPVPATPTGIESGADILKSSAGASTPLATPISTGAVTPNAGVYTGDLSTFTPAQQNSIIAQRNAVMSTPGIENVVQQPTGGISAGQMFNNVKAGIGQTFAPTGEFSLASTGEFAGENYGKLGSAASPILSAALEPEPYQEPEKKKYTSGYRLSPDFQGYTPATPNPYYRPTGLGYAGGGLMDVMMARGGSFDDEGQTDDFAAGGMPRFNGVQTSKVSKPKKATLTGARNIANMDALDAAMAEQNNARYGANMSQMTMPKTGIAGLGELPYATGGMAGGRYLSGGGDGMSDSIPATINGKQPARLADGEFVIPADVVSHLGNGSSNAGAKKLYGMMDRVRKARTGKKKQAPAVKTDKYMAA